MSAVVPITDAEKAAQAWAREQDLKHQQMVAMIEHLREQADDALAEVSAAHGHWRQLADARDQMTARAEALKQRLADEL